MHIDVFYIKIDGTLEKHVYLTLVYRSDQSKVDTMNVAEHVLAEFANDFTAINELYAKSDNASCYHGNFILENL